MALLRLSELHPEWIVTIAFYKAVHVAEAMFAEVLKKHSFSHPSRLDALKDHPRFASSALFKNFRPLYAMSLVARYLADNDNVCYQTFSDYLADEKVKDEAIKGRLVKFEQVAITFLGNENKAALKKVNPADV